MRAAFGSSLRQCTSWSAAQPGSALYGGRAAGRALCGSSGRALYGTVPVLCTGEWQCFVWGLSPHTSQRRRPPHPRPRPPRSPACAAPSPSAHPAPPVERPPPYKSLQGTAMSGAAPLRHSAHRQRCSHHIRLPFAPHSFQPAPPRSAIAVRPSPGSSAPPRGGQRQSCTACLRRRAVCTDSLSSTASAPHVALASERRSARECHSAKFGHVHCARIVRIVHADAPARLLYVH